MAAKPCDTCVKEGVGAIIYGNCQQFLAWRREIIALMFALNLFSR
jgi:hypothetical protein